MSRPLLIVEDNELLLNQSHIRKLADGVGKLSWIQALDGWGIGGSKENWVSLSLSFFSSFFLLGMHTYFWRGRRLFSPSRYACARWTEWLVECML
jgi:hypothetical protein